jgi:hypothetical protein
MHCIFCHNNHVLNFNPKIQARKWLIIYSTTNGIIALRKHINSKNLIFFKKLKNKLIVL